MATDLVVSMVSCSMCNRAISKSHKFLCCAFCKHYIHRSCSKLAREDVTDISNWTCLSCAEDLFPFGCIDDEVQFFNCLFIYSQGLRISDFLVNNINQLRLIPASLKFDKDIDPNNNGFNTYKLSNYASEDALNSIISHSDFNTTFSVLHINARSLLKNLDAVCCLLSRIHYKFSVVVVTETWTDNSTEDLVDLPGYNKIIKHRTNKKGGGVGIFVDSKLTFHPLLELNTFDISDSVFESLFVKIVVSSSESVTVGGIYRPPGGDIKEFNDAFERLSFKLNCHRSEVFLAGDYNINLLNYDAHSETDNFLNLMSDNQFYPLITLPTRFSNTGCTLIDNIFTNSLNDNYKPGILISDISDHLPVYCIRNNDTSCSVGKAPDHTTSYRLMDDNRIQVFLDKLAVVHWNLPDHDTNVSYNHFFHVFMNLYDECFPVVTKKANSFRCNTKPWFTAALNKSVRKKIKLYNIWLHTRSATDLCKYKKYKNKLTSVLRAAEQSYYATRFSEIQGNAAKTWQLIKKVLPNSSKKNSAICIKRDDELTDDPQVLSNLFNNFFASIGNNLAKVIPNTEGSHRDYFNKFNLPLPKTSIFLHPVTPSEIVNVVSGFKSNKACGFDDVSPRVLKMVINCISHPLADIVNLSFNEGLFPDMLKLAKVVPLHKGGDNTILSNYRPVSVLSIFSKVFERLLYNRLNNYLISNKLLCDCQFGFRKQHTTSMAILQLVDKIASECDCGNITIGVFLDLSKAFDTINHNILLDKLSMYGIRGNCLHWITSYLTGRRQFVSLRNTQSDLLPITCGVPQGSILGPLLFTIYINDIVNSSQILQMILFADDTNVFLSGRDILEVNTALNIELAKLSKWFKLNKLSLNISKTNAIIFKSKQKKLSVIPSVFIDKIKVTLVNCCKFLGVVINNSLDWSDHIKLVNRKVSKSIGILRYVKRKLPENILRSLYYSLVHPYYEYCNIVWAVKNSVCVQKLTITQKKAIRVITNSSWHAHTHLLFRRLCILKILEIHKLQVACFMFKVNNGCAPTYFMNMFVTNDSTHSHFTRQASDYHLIAHRTNILKFSLRIAGPILWNSLSLTVRSCNTLSSFKRRYKKILLV